MKKIPKNFIAQLDTTIRSKTVKDRKANQIKLLEVFEKRSKTKIGALEAKIATTLISEFSKKSRRQDGQLELTAELLWRLLEQPDDDIDLCPAFWTLFNEAVSRYFDEMQNYHECLDQHAQGGFGTPSVCQPWLDRMLTEAGRMEQYGAQLKAHGCT